MKVIHCDDIVLAVEALCIKANIYLTKDIKHSLSKSAEKEDSETGKLILEALVENAEIARNEEMPICQDTGMAIVFVEIGQEVSILGGLLEDAINQGVRNGYKNGYLRKSIVSDPFERKNTGDNTPAIIHYNIVTGDNLKITIAPKGFGSENMSAIKMMTPSEGIEGAKAFIIETVKKAGPNPCPPIIVGIGFGGNFEKSAYLAKKALLRPIDEKNKNEYYSKLEEELLTAINNLGIGPGGLGGRTTALSVNIEVFPTHIAGLPVAVNISCHATRHAETIL